MPAPNWPSMRIRPHSGYLSFPWIVVRYAFREGQNPMGSIEERKSLAEAGL
jgi:hypothetical protein